MNKEQQWIAIVEVCGFKPMRYVPPVAGQFILEPRNFHRWKKGGIVYYIDDLPDFLHDLNAMHEAEKSLSGINYEQYMLHVQRLVDPRGTCHGAMVAWRVMRATAAQRAEAFLRTLNLWADS